MSDSPDAIEATPIVKLTEYEAGQAAAVFHELNRRDDPYALTRTIEHIIKMRRPEVAGRSCLVCGHVREFAVWHDPTGVGVCKQCRDARHVLSGGATYKTPHTSEEIMAAGDRIMQHYLGENGADYGDARFMFDMWLEAQNELRFLRAKV